MACLDTKTGVSRQKLASALGYRDHPYNIRGSCLFAHSTDGHIAAPNFFRKGAIRFLHSANE
jgi:hypothetical protein